MNRRTRRISPKRVVAALSMVACLSLPLVIAPVTSVAAPSQAELDRARSRLMELEREFELVAEKYNLVHEELNSLRAKIGVIDLEVRELESHIDAKQDDAVALAIELYKGGGSTGTFEAVLNSVSVTQIEQRLLYLESSESEQAKVFERLSVDKSLLRSRLESLEEATAKAQAEEDELAALRSEVEGRVASQQDEIGELNALVAAAEERAAARAEAEARAAARAAERADAQEAAAPDPGQAPAPSAITSGSTNGAPAPNAAAQAAVDAALSQVGKPYQWGASGPNSYDCSGLTMWAWGQAGVSLPHNSGAQYSATARVDQSDWQPGDLLFAGSPIHHVGMYIGNGQMVEAPYTGANVRVVSAFRSDYAGAGRP
jgi:cell wall-associated NlpC family hydrolase